VRTAGGAGAGAGAGMGGGNIPSHVAMAGEHWY